LILVTYIEHYPVSNAHLRAALCAVHEHPMKECSKEMNFPGDSAKSKGGIREDESTPRVGSGARNLPA